MRHLVCMQIPTCLQMLPLTELLAMLAAVSAAYYAVQRQRQHQANVRQDKPALQPDGSGRSPGPGRLRASPTSSDGTEGSTDVSLAACNTMPTQADACLPSG